MARSGRANKQNSRESRKERRNSRRISVFTNPVIESFETHPSQRPQPKAKPLQSQTEAQAHYIMSIESSKITFGVGPAGTGKTYVCGAMAADMLLNHQIEKIVVTRPAVDAGEEFGFLPGELDEKYAPYLMPFMDVMNERMGKSTVEYMVKTGKIEPATLAHMRGRTFKNAFIILDEAQNVTPTQMKMFLTRIGPGCTVVINGDPKQKDIPGESGLVDATNKIRHIPGVRIIQFEKEDVVRSGIVQKIVEAYES